MPLEDYLTEIRKLRWWRNVAMVMAYQLSVETEMPVEIALPFDGIPEYMGQLSNDLDEAQRLCGVIEKDGVRTLTVDAE